MMLTKNAIKRTALATAVTATLGTAVIPDQASAVDLIFNLTGWFTMLNASGTGSLTNDDAPGAPMYGMRTPVTGTMTFDTVTNNGTLSIQPFSFFGSGNAAATTITFADVDGPGGASTLMLGNMGFNWNGNVGIPVSIAWDGKGLLDAIGQGLAVSNTIAATSADFACDTNISCATPATENFPFDFTGFGTYTLPIGASPVTTTTFNTTDIGPITLGTNPSGTLPLIADTIGGSPMKAGPFPGFNANFDFDHMTLISDGSGPTFTQPADVNFIAPEQATPAAINVNLGTVTDEAPPGTTVEYSIDGKAINDPTKTWIADNNGNNTISVNATQTVTTLTVDWRATDTASAQSFQTQNVTVTITDTTAPSITGTPANVSTSVTSTADNVCFGTLTATDAVDPTPTIQWSHDGFTFNTANPIDNCSTGFGPNANTVTWRVTDDTGNTATYMQTVTLNLPAGITGKACTVDLATAGSRLLEGDFTMRTSTGSITGNIDHGVTGNIDTTVFCTDPNIVNCNPTPPAVTLVSGQPFFGFDWSAAPVRLFDQGTWTFETCPFPRVEVNAGTPSADWISDPANGGDGSTKCGGQFTPNPITMTVGPGQLGAHMLFDWSSNVAIDVVVVWDVGCNKFELTTTDPDGDGILSTPMVDGPFKGFNAAFDVKTQAGEPPIADGGYTVTVATAQNPVAGASPLPLTTQALPAFTADSTAVRSCVGGCYKFTTTDLLDGNDAGGAYKYAQVTLPLSEATPFWSVYRKYDEATMTWGPFTTNNRNNVQTAPLDQGTGECPEPGNGTYDRPFSGALAGKLRENDMCVQLTIEDDGPNDANPAAGTVDDPGGVAEVPAGVLPKPESSGGCTVAGSTVDPAKGGSWWMLAGFLTWMGWKRRSGRTH
jgi:hypothetical protein